MNNERNSGFLYGRAVLGLLLFVSFCVCRQARAEDAIRAVNLSTAALSVPFPLFTPTPSVPCPLPAMGNLDFENPIYDNLSLPPPPGPFGNWLNTWFFGWNSAIPDTGMNGTGQSLALSGGWWSVSNVKQVVCIDQSCSYEFCFWAKSDGVASVVAEIRQLGSNLPATYFPSVANGDRLDGFVGTDWTYHCIAVGTTSAPLQAGVEQLEIALGHGYSYFPPFISPVPFPGPLPLPLPIPINAVSGPDFATASLIVFAGTVWFDNAKWTETCPQPTPGPNEPLLQVLGIYPTPFSAQVTIGIELRENATIDLVMYSVAGEIVDHQTFFRSAGRGSVSWQGTNRSGSRLASGIYPVKIEASTPAGLSVRLFQTLVIAR